MIKINLKTGWKGNMVNKILLGVVFVLAFSGCQRTLSPTFVQSMREHRQDTQLVNQSLVRTFQEEMDKDERPEAKAAYQEIINNLNTISHQSWVLEKYVWHELTEDELILVIRSKWRTKP